MSGFDHAAAAQRSAERQEAVESAVRAAEEFVDRQQLVGDNEAFIRLSSAVLIAIIESQTKRPSDDGLNNVMKRKADQLVGMLAKQAKSGHEADVMGLKLAKQLLDNGTSQLLIDFGMWESKTFRARKSYKAVCRDPKGSPFNPKGPERVVQSVEVDANTPRQQVEDWARQAAEEKGLVFIELQEV